ncbi:hypothetical protein KUCAC02_008176, partial [Chaenocephalus aceratus]
VSIVELVVTMTSGEDRNKLRDSLVQRQIQSDSIVMIDTVRKRRRGEEERRKRLCSATGSTADGV